ncbi:alpha,alpha-trehalase TreF [Rhizobacter sp. Root1221]|uniref:alpha,alpha-trehalase TreF n=1 Tax=Rhizobacter sp. Root1221 TaxID=1736433 RepID=UPI0009E6F173|nr:alpha,alpha-trehalase TreF [Rhizobacter sp. Root1221]
MRHGAPETRPAVVLSLVEKYGRLFTDVQMEDVFGDGKVFVDAVARQSPAVIRALYEAEGPLTGTALAEFVRRHFDLPWQAGSHDSAVPYDDAMHHVATLWPQLTRQPVADAVLRETDTLLPLPHPYVVPGGRFSEVYYWDSYFTMLGLVESGHAALAEGMVLNFAHLIDRHGHVPNGNRTYYLSRSQPPFFFKMIECVAAGGTPAYARFLPQLKAEHGYWMAGEHLLDPGTAVSRVVRLPDGHLLNRFWDDRDEPRDESYREDVHTARDSDRPYGDVYRDLRAAAESGWDFSSRWCADPDRLSSIETTAILPVDLNSLLLGLEEAIATGCAQAGDTAGEALYRARADARREALRTYLWDNTRGHHVDYHWLRGVPRTQLSAATVVPLFLGQASHDEAARVADAVASQLLMRNGIVTTTVCSGQQWDVPNGWAPLQWMAVDGLRRYGHDTLAREIGTRWIGCIQRVHRDTGRLLEKYDVMDDKPGGGGEYPTQCGFGWTNAVLVKLKKLYPDP